MNTEEQIKETFKNNHVIGTAYTFGTEGLKEDIKKLIQAEKEQYLDEFVNYYEELNEVSCTKGCSHVRRCIEQFKKESV